MKIKYYSDADVLVMLSADVEHQNRHVMDEVLYRMRKGKWNDERKIFAY